MDYIAFLAIAPVAIVIIIFTFFKILPFRSEPASKPLLWFLGIITLLIFFNTLEFLAPTETLTLLFAQIQHIFNHSFPIAWFLFALSYAGLEKKVQHPIFGLYLIIPLIAVVSAFTNQYHSLFWAQIWYFPVFNFLTMRVSYGPLFWGTGVFFYLLLLLGAYFILEINLRGPSLYKKQSLWMVSGVLFPLIFNLLYIFKFFPFLQKDYSPVAFALSGIFFYFGVYRHRLLIALPKPRRAVIQALQDGVLILDNDFYLMDFNDAAKKFLQLTDNDLGICLKDTELGKVLFSNNVLAPEINNVFYFKFCWFQIHLHTFDGAQHSAAGQILIIKNITEMLKIQHTVSAYRNQLRNQEFYLSLGHIAANVAHEVNNPLSYILSGHRSIRHVLEQNLSVFDSKEQNEILSIMNDTCQKLSTIQMSVQNLLALVKQKTTVSVSRIVVLTEIQSAIDSIQSEYDFSYSLVGSRSLTILGNKELFNLVCLSLIRSGLLPWMKVQSTLPQQLPETQMMTDIEVTGRDSLIVIDVKVQNTSYVPEQIKPLGNSLNFSNFLESNIELSLTKQLISCLPEGNLRILSIDPFRAQMEFQVDCIP
jgi:two-component system NtrC family sensor kinase